MAEPRDDGLPFVSVIIPVHREVEELRACLRSLDGLDYPKERLEIILVNDGGEGPSKEILLASGHRVLESGGQGPSCARNMGIAEARGEFVAFTDADCAVDAAWLRELLRTFDQDDGKLAGVGGSQALPPAGNVFSRRLHRFFGLLGFFLRSYTKTYTRTVDVDHNPTCNAMYRMEALREAGGFTPGLWPGEDLDLDVRITRKGWRLKYNPQAVVYHRRPGTVAGFARMMYRYGVWAGGFLTRRYGFFRWLSWEPFLFYGLFFLNVAVAWAAPLGGLAFFSGGLAVIWTYFFVRSRSPFFGAFCTWALLVTLACWNVGFVRGLFARLPGEGRRAP